MPPVVSQPCTLRAEFVDLELADQAAMILACKAVDSYAIRERDERLDDCRAWHEADGR